MKFLERCKGVHTIHWSLFLAREGPLPCKQVAAEEWNKVVLAKSKYLKAFEGRNSKKFFSLGHVMFAAVDGLHWWLYDVMPEQGLVVIFDSLPEEKCDQNVDYISVESAPRQPQSTFLVDILRTLDKDRHWRVRSAPGPVQTDGVSCGVYVCYSAYMRAHGSFPAQTAAPFYSYFRQFIFRTLLSMAKD